jgi:hypothetical protein
MGSSVSEFVVDGGFEISKYFACCFPVCFPWVVGETGKAFDGECNVWACIEGDV